MECLGRYLPVWDPGRSTIAHRHVIDRIERIIEPTEPNLTKNPNFFILVFRRFFGLQASYRAETLTPDRSGAPRRFQKIENHTESIEPIDSIDRSRDRSNRSTAAMFAQWPGYYPAVEPRYHGTLCWTEQCWWKFSLYY